MTEQKIRVENGFGEPVGMIVIGELFKEEMTYPRMVTLEWVRKRMYSKNTFTMQCSSLMLPIRKSVEHGLVIQLKHKDRMKLKRAGLLLPYEENKQISATAETNTG